MKYISLLRGINVSGQKAIKMSDLKSLYQEIGFQNVITYIQSGNVVFESDVKNGTSIKKKIQSTIESKYQFQVPVEIRTHHEISNIIEAWPFDSIDLAENGTKVLLTFLSDSPLKKNIDELMKHVVNPDQLIIKGKAVYLYCPNGYGKSKLSNNFLEKKLGVDATTRNWKTVQKLYELSS